MKRVKPSAPPLHRERTFIVVVSLPGDWSEPEAERAVEGAVRDLQRTVYYPVRPDGRPAPATVRGAG